jgi:hypothetical protein
MHHAPRQQPRSRLLVLLLLFFLLPVVASAQTDWLRKGKELLGSGTTGAGTTTLSAEQAGAGLKEALRVGSETVVARLGAPDGFNADPQVRIPLPASLDKVRTALKGLGMSGMLDDLEVRLNRAAEAATPRAKELFWQAIAEMTMEDAMAIYHGPSDAATRYFQKKMSPPLAAEMRPVVAESLSQVGAIQSYEAVMGQYRSLPLVPDVKADLGEHVVEKSMDGIFYYLAREEAAIRQDPGKRTTELLRQVFASP